MGHVNAILKPFKRIIVSVRTNCFDFFEIQQSVLVLAPLKEPLRLWRLAYNSKLRENTKRMRFEVSLTSKPLLYYNASIIRMKIWTSFQKLWIIAVILEPGHVLCWRRTLMHVSQCSWSNLSQVGDSRNKTEMGLTQAGDVFETSVRCFWQLCDYLQWKIHLHNFLWTCSELKQQARILANVSGHFGDTLEIFGECCSTSHQQLQPSQMLSLAFQSVLPKVKLKHW